MTTMDTPELRSALVRLLDDHQLHPLFQDDELRLGIRGHMLLVQIAKGPSTPRQLASDAGLGLENLSYFEQCLQQDGLLMPGTRLRLHPDFDEVVAALQDPAALGEPASYLGDLLLRALRTEYRLAWGV